MDLTTSPPRKQQFSAETPCENLQIQELEELKQGLNVWSKPQELLEQEALHEIENFSKNDIEEGEITEESSNDKLDTGVSSLNISEFIKRQEELKKRKEIERASQVSETSKAAAKQVLKSHKRKQHEDGRVVEKKVKLKEVRERKKNGNESDSDYVPSDGISDECDGETVVRKRKRNNDSAKVEKVKDDGSIVCYKARLESYYEKLEEERSILNRTEGEEDIHVIKGGLKVPSSVWKNLYR